VWPVVKVTLSPGHCTVDGDQPSLGFWAFGASFTSIDDDSYTAVEFQGQDLHCCTAPLADFESEHPCTQATKAETEEEIVDDFDTTTDETGTMAPHPTTTPAPTTAPAPTCPINFLLHSASSQCFYFSRNPRTWEEAERSCKLMGSGVTLARPDSVSQNQFLVSQMKKKPGHNWWFDLNDRRSEGFMRFSNGAKPSFNTWPWASGEPNDYMGWLYGGEDCVMYTEDSYYKWNDEDCDDEARYVCQVAL